VREHRPAATARFPKRRSNTGFKRASFSTVASSRIPSSVVKGRSDRGGATSGTISPARNPESRASRARCWLCAANASCSSRVIPSSRASNSAVSPISNPLIGSVSAGRSDGFGNSVFQRAFQNAASLPPNDF
jgi:hypothetical protein